MGQKLGSNYWLWSVRACWSSVGERRIDHGYKEEAVGKNRSGAFLLSRAIKYLLVALLFIPALPLPAAEDVEYDPYRAEFVLGNVVFVTLHEIGHIVIEDFDIPVLGNKEDAADTLAAIRLIRGDRERPEQEDRRLIRMLLTTADANRILWQRGLERNNPVLYLARHPLSVQRAARINCLVFGSDPELFEPLPELVGLPEFRADWCEEEYADAEQAFLWVRHNLVPESPVTTNDHELIYDAAREPAHETIRNWLIQNQILERTVVQIDATKVLPDSFTLRTLSCGSPDAYWDEEARELVFCYDLIEAFYELSADQGIKELVEQIRTFHQDTRVPSVN